MSGLSSIEHVVVLMLENRSMDHMLGYLYSANDNVSPSGDPFEGLTGSDSNPGADGSAVAVFQITPATADAYFMPGADPGEGYMATNSELFGSNDTPAASTVPTASTGSSSRRRSQTSASCRWRSLARASASSRSPPSSPRSRISSSG